MIGNQVIMKSYKEIKNEYKQINIEKEYENDNYLIQTLKRTSKCKNDKKILSFQNNIKNLLSLIYKKIQLQNDPDIKPIKLENDHFHKDYHSILENFQKSTIFIFKDLIKQYNIRGYKLPNFTYDHNLFKINTLIEENNDKLELVLREDKKNKNKNKEPLAIKTMNYLKKLNFLLNLLLSKDENKSKKIPKYIKNKLEIKSTKNESIEELKNSIEQLKLLIKNDFLIMNNGTKRTTIIEKRKSSFISSKDFRTFKSIKPRKSNDDFSSLKNNMINKNQKEGGGEPGSGIELETPHENNEHLNILPEGKESNNSMKSNFSANSQKEVKSPGNKRRQEDILYCTPFDTYDKNNNNNNFLAKTSKQLIKLKEIYENNKENNKIDLLNTIKNTLNSNEENSIIPINFNTQYSNTFSNYKSNEINNNINNKYLRTQPKKLRISLKKNIDLNNYHKLKSHIIKTPKKMNSLFHQTTSNSKIPKTKTAFFVKTQTYDRRNKSRNNNLFLHTNTNTNTNASTYKYDLNLKTQNNFVNNMHYKTQDEYLKSAYKRLKKGNYENLEELIRKYLRDIKHFEQDKEDFLVSHYNYKNLKSNLTELNGKIGLNNIGKKTERLYFNNHLSKRILPLLKSMKEKEMNINRFEKIISSGINKYK